MDILGCCFKQTNIEPPGSIGHQIVGCMLHLLCCIYYVASFGVGYIPGLYCQTLPLALAKGDVQ